MKSKRKEKGRRKVNNYEKIAQEIGKLVEQKQRAYGNSVDVTEELFQVWLKRYQNKDNTYTIPSELLSHLLLMVRMVDKINRIVTNPKGDLMGENPYSDLVGYSLIGVGKHNE